MSPSPPCSEPPPPSFAPVRRALRTASVAASVLGYTLLAPMGYLPFALLCWLWRKRPLVAARRLQTCIQQGFRFALAWLRLVRIADCRYRDIAEQLPDEPCVVVANHPTQLDVLAVTAALGRATTIVKPSVFNRRMIRPFLVGAGLLEGPGKDPVSIGRVLEHALQRLRDGMRIYVFPEGSRSLPDRLRPFGRLAFEIACRADVPVVVLGIRCQPKYLSPQVPLFSPPAGFPRHRIELLAIERPEAHGRDSRRLCAHVERRLSDWYFGRSEPQSTPQPALAP